MNAWLEDARMERKGEDDEASLCRIYRGFMNLHSVPSGTKRERQRLYIQVEITTLLPYLNFIVLWPLRELPPSRICLIFIPKPKSFAMNLYYISNETRFISDRYDSKSTEIINVHTHRHIYNLYLFKVKYIGRFIYGNEYIDKILSYI